MKCSTLCLVALALGASGAHGQTTDIGKRLADCAAIEADTARLECFDRLAAETETVPATPGAGDVGKWLVNTDTNPLDDSKTVTLLLTAEGLTSKWNGPISLIIRCKSGTTALYISWGEYLGSEAVVTTRVGKQAASVKRWSMSTDSKATFYPGKVISFIRRLVVTDRLVAQVTPYGENPKMAVFDLTGLNEAIKPLKATCGWK